LLGFPKLWICDRYITGHAIEDKRALRNCSGFGYPRLFCDETPVRVLDPGRGRTKICQFWAHATDDRSWKGPAPPAVAYIFAGGRGKKEIAGQLAGFEGVLQVDGYAAYLFNIRVTGRLPKNA
jgi:hypothetical protein